MSEGGNLGSQQLMWEPSRVSESDDIIGETMPAAPTRRVTWDFSMHQVERI